MVTQTHKIYKTYAEENEKGSKIVHYKSTKQERNEDISSSIKLSNQKDLQNGLKKEV